MSRALGSRSSPISRRPGSSVKNCSACPPAPRVASTRTASDPSGWRRVSAGVSSSTQRCSSTGTWPKSSGFPATATPSRVWGDAPAPGSASRAASAPRAARGCASAPRSLSEVTNLALGKYARVGSDRGHDPRACASDNVAECFIAGRGEVLFVGLLVFVPGLRIPDLEVIDSPDHYAVLGQVGVAAVVDRQGDAALGVGMLFVGAGSEIAQERSCFRIAPRGLARTPRELLEFRSRVDGQAVILALGDHQPPCQRVAELGGQREPPFVVEFWRVGAEKHQLTSYRDRVLVSPQRFSHHTPQPPTFPHKLGVVGVFC